MVSGYAMLAATCASNTATSSSAFVSSQGTVGVHECPPNIQRSVRPIPTPTGMAIRSTAAASCGGAGTGGVVDGGGPRHPPQLGTHDSEHEGNASEWQHSDPNLDTGGRGTTAAWNSEEEERVDYGGMLPNQIPTNKQNQDDTEQLRAS